MDSLLNRSLSADTATSSVTLPSSLGNSRRNSGAAINSVKRRIDLNTPVINRNGRIEEAGETDDVGIFRYLTMVHYFGVMLPL